MPAELRPVEIQYEEYLESKNFIENTFEKLINLTTEIISDYKNANKTLTEAVGSSVQTGLTVNTNEIDKLSKEMKNSLKKEFQTIENVFNNFNTINDECDAFTDLEGTVRQKFLTNPEGFTEADLKKLIAFKTTPSKLTDNMLYDKFKDLVSSLDENNTTDDLVIDTESVTNQIQKCPITGKAIEVPFKNKCGHTYERDAILAYCKGRTASHTKRCPYAGCANTVCPADIK